MQNIVIIHFSKIAARIIFLLLFTINIYSILSAQTPQKEYGAVPIVSSKEQIKKLKIAKLYVSYYDNPPHNGRPDKYSKFNFGKKKFFYISNHEKIAFLIQSLQLKRVDNYQKTPFTFILKFYSVKEWQPFMDSVKMYYSLSAIGKSEPIKEVELRKFPDQIIFQDTIHPQNINNRYFIKNPIVMPIEACLQ